MDKLLIAERFARARNTYGREARVQQQVAEKMMHLLMDHTPVEQFSHIVEFGCGTGSYSRLLQNTLSPHSLLLNDLCPEMEQTLSDLLPRATFAPGDAETMEFPPQSQLITSCSTLQWFNDPGAFFANCTRSLTPKGYLAFSTFGPQNMHEIKRLTGHGLEYLQLEELVQLLRASNYQVIHAHQEWLPLIFDTPQEVLKHLKETGVTGTEKRVWTRGRLHAFYNDYINLCSSAQGRVTLTYHPIYIIARKITHE